MNNHKNSTVNVGSDSDEINELKIGNEIIKVRKAGKS